MEMNGFEKPWGVGHDRSDPRYRTIFIDPESPWQNGFCESFNGRRR